VSEWPLHLCTVTPVSHLQPYLLSGRYISLCFLPLYIICLSFYTEVSENMVFFCNNTKVFRKAETSVCVRPERVNK
jgi:hypothetical protein